MKHFTGTPKILMPSIEAFGLSDRALVLRYRAGRPTLKSFLPVIQFIGLTADGAYKWLKGDALPSHRNMGGTNEQIRE